MAETHIQFRCIEVEQPIGTFYIGAIPAQDVLAIAYADIRRIEERDIERIVGIQRELNMARVAEIKQYVGNADATFPTSVILAISGKHASFDSRLGVMTVRREENTAKIIDGQHRIAGLEGFAKTFQVNVTVFIDMELQDQAMTFATINLAQTKVSKSLVYDLYAFQQARSPQKSCHNIARLLHTEEGSPFKGRIKILGKATGEEHQFITQATFVESLLGYLTDDPMRDRDALKRGKPLFVVSGALEQQLIFRPLFAVEKDAEIARIVWNYFEAVAERWPTAWFSNEPGDMLNRTNGFRALMRFLAPCYRAKRDKPGRLPKTAVLEVLRALRLRDSDFNIESYRPGTSGETAMFRDLREQSGLE